MDTNVTICDQSKDDPKFGKVAFIEDLLLVSVFIFESDQKRLQIQSTEVVTHYKDCIKD
jgi:hypothetical protein